MIYFVCQSLYKNTNICESFCHLLFSMNLCMTKRYLFFRLLCLQFHIFFCFTTFDCCLLVWNILYNIWILCFQILTLDFFTRMLCQKFCQLPKFYYQNIKIILKEILEIIEEKKQLILHQETWLMNRELPLMTKRNVLCLIYIALVASPQPLGNCGEFSLKLSVIYQISSFSENYNIFGLPVSKILSFRHQSSQLYKKWAKKVWNLSDNMTYFIIEYCNY